MLEIKYKRYNIFWIVQSYMGVNTYATVAWRVNPIRNSNQPNNYRTLIKEIIQLEPCNWPKFQEHLRNLYSAKICQTEAQPEQKKNLQQKDKQENPMKWKNIIQKT